MNSQKNKYYSIFSSGNEIQQTNIINSNSICLQDYLSNLPEKREPLENVISSLVYDSCPVQLIGRENELEELKNFLEDERKILWWAITGLPGSGKTRLAYDFLKKRVEKNDWVARFLPWPVFAKDYRVRNVSVGECSKNILVIIDYMYAYEEEIASWIEWLLAHFNCKYKLRLLIIEREYVCGGAQMISPWQEFFKGGFAEPSNFYRLRYKENNLNLNDKELSEKNAFDIVKYYIKQKGKEFPEGLIKHIVTLSTKSNGNRVSPLLLLLFAEYYLEHRNGGYSTDIYDTIIGQIVEREELSLYRLLDAKTSTDKQIIKSVMVVATIVSNLGEEDALTTVSTAFGLMVDDVKKQIEAFRETQFAYFNADSNSFIKGIQPDLVGEYFVYKYFERMSNKKVKMILDVICSNHKRALLSFLSRFLADNDQRLRKCGKYDLFNSYVPEDHEMIFRMIDEKGKIKECEVLFTFENDETGKNYIVYTDYSEDSEGNMRVFASIYTPGDDRSQLLPIETAEEWKIIETILSELQNEVRESHGGPLDEDKLIEQIDKKLKESEA